MQQIIYDATKVKVYEALEKWCLLAKKDTDFLAGFWKRILENQEVYKEFVYYLENHELIAQYMVKIRGKKIR